MSETDLSRSIRDALARFGFWTERVNAGRVKARGGWHYGASNGTPDLVVVAPSYGWLEVKTDTGDLRDEQTAWHDRARNFGVRVAVVRSVEAALREVQAWATNDRASMEPKGAA